MRSLVQEFARDVARRFREFRALPAKDALRHVIPAVLLLVGFALAAASTFGDAVLADSASFSGSLDPLSGRSEPFSSSYPIVRFTLTSVPSCSFRFHALNAQEEETFRTTALLPPVAQSLNCDRTQALYGPEVVLLVFDNPRNETQDYAVQADFFDVRTPYSWAAVPGALLLMAGAIAFIMRLFRTSVERFVEEMDALKGGPAGREDETVDPGPEDEQEEKEERGGGDDPPSPPLA